MTWVSITHPAHGGSTDVIDTSLKVWLARGWVVNDDPPIGAELIDDDDNGDGDDNGAEGDLPLGGTFQSTKSTKTTRPSSVSTKRAWFTSDEDDD